MIWWEQFVPFMKFNLILGLTIVKAFSSPTDIPNNMCRSLSLSREKAVKRCKWIPRMVCSWQSWQCLSQKCSLRTEKNVKNEEKQQQKMFQIEIQYQMSTSDVRALWLPANELNCELERFKFTSISIFSLQCQQQSRSHTRQRRLQFYLEK